MKKIFTLLFAAALAVPTVMAETVTIKLHERIGTGISSYAPGEVLGEMTQEVLLNADRSYTINNFLGYEKANLTFYINKDMCPDDFPDRYGFMVVYTALPSVPAYDDVDPYYPTMDDYTSRIEPKNTRGQKFEIRPIYTAEDWINAGVPGISDDIKLSVTDARAESGIFVGDNADYKLRNLSYWCLNSNDYTGLAAIVKRTYFKEANGKYTAYIQGTSCGYTEKEGEEWPDTYKTDNLEHYLVFDLPINAGIDNVVADDNENAPVEYFNLQGVRVENPANGLYIRRQGLKVEKVTIR